jgi:hypothetical protein
MDWDGCVWQGSELINASWVTDFLGAAQDQRGRRKADWFPASR